MTDAPSVPCRYRQLLVQIFPSSVLTEWLLSALCSRWLTGQRMDEDAPKPTPMITLTNDEVGWQAAAHPTLSDIASVEP